MDEEPKLKFPKYLDHLNKTYLEEIAYHLWITKGARFNAHSRLIAKHNLSSSSVAYLTVYLIIFGLIGVFQSSEKPFIEPSLINFGSFAGSILILIFTQLESAKSYELRAHLFHTCAVDLSELLNEIRIFKTLGSKEEQVEKNKKIFAEKMEKKYTEILKKYPNHDSIDYDTFIAKKRGDSLPPVTNVFIYKILFFRFLKVKLLYYILIVLPPLWLLAYYI
jgi:hypothetical protein